MHRPMRLLSFFFFFFLWCDKPWNGCFSWESEEIKGSDWSYVGALAEWVWGSIPLGTRTDKHLGRRAEHQEILSEALPSVTQEPVLWKPWSLFPNVRKCLSAALKRPNPTLVSLHNKSGLWIKSDQHSTWTSSWQVEVSSSEEVWINSKQWQSNYFHLINEITFRVRESEHWTGRKKSKFRLFIATPNPPAYAVSLMFSKISSMTTSLKRRFVPHAGNKHVIELQDCLQRFESNRITWLRAERNYCR